MFDPGARQKIHHLLRMELGTEIGFDQFRIAFEDLVNFQLDPGSVPTAELLILRALFDVVVWYSPFPDERAEIPTYIGEVEMIAAVEQARHALERLDPSTR